MSIRTYRTRSIFWWNFTWLVHSKLLHKIVVMCWSKVSFSSELNCLLCNCTEFAGFWMQCNSMFVIVSYLGIFWLVTHSSPINHKGGHVFHWIHENTVCLLKTTVHSVYMYLPENVLLYGEREEGTDKSTFLEPRFKDVHFKLLQTTILSWQKDHTFFFHYPALCV